MLGWARDLNVGQVYLTHMGNSLDYATLVRELPDWAAALITAAVLGALAFIGTPIAVGALAVAAVVTVTVGPPAPPVVPLV